MLDALEAGVDDPRLVAARIDGWLNHVRYGNTVGLSRSVLRKVPTEVIGLLNSPRVTALFPSRRKPE